MKQFSLFLLILLSCLYSKEQIKNSNSSKIKNNIKHKNDIVKKDIKFKYKYKYKFKCKSLYIIDKNNDLLEKYKNDILYLYQNDENKILIKKEKDVINFNFFGKGKLVDVLLRKSWYYIYKNKFLNINLYIPSFSNSDNDIPDTPEIITSNSEIYLTFGTKTKSFLCEKKKKKYKKEK